MDQQLKQNPPSIEQQLVLVRGARHLVAEIKDAQVVLTNEHYPILRAIEENLLAVKLYNESCGPVDQQITLSQLHDFQSEANEDVFIKVFGVAIGQHVFRDFKRNNYQIAIHKLDGDNRAILSRYIKQHYPIRKEVSNA